MPKRKSKLKLEEKIMSQVKTGKIVMKPKWYFVAGSLLLFGGLVALSVGAIFLVNLTSFALRRHGPMAGWWWWAPVLAVIGIILGARLLKKYDFSYKKNFTLIVIFFILSVLFAGCLIDRLGLNDYWARRKPMKRFYQRFEPRNDFRKPGRRF